MGDDGWCNGGGRGQGCVHVRFVSVLVFFFIKKK